MCNLKFSILKKKFISTIIVTFIGFIIWSLGQKMAYADENWVEVEQSPLVIEDDGKTKRITYLNYVDRRSLWSFRFTLLGTDAKLSDYTLSTTQLLSSLKSKDLGFEGIISISYNFGVFSTGADFGISTQSFRSNVQVFQPKASVHLMADALFKNPYAVPFVKFGASQMTFENPSSSDIPELKSKLATFYSVGGMFALDWFQKILAMDAYFGYGLNATYLVIEYEVFPSIPLEADVLPKVKQSSLKFGIQLCF